MWTWMLLACVAPSPSETESSPTETESETELDTEDEYVGTVELLEEEPNDVAVLFEDNSYRLDVDNIAAAQDLGVLRGTGSAYYQLGGTIDWSGDEAAYVHDVDAFAFEFELSCEVYFALQWDVDTSDLDVLIFDRAGELVDWSASTTTDPEERGGGYATYPPDEVFYLVLLGYSSVTPDVVDDYIFGLEPVCWRDEDVR